MSSTVPLKLLTPDERVAYLPCLPAVSSAGLGWDGIRVEHIPGQPPSDLAQPPSESLLVVHQHNTTESGWFSCEGVTVAGPAVAGTMAVGPPGAAGHWRWTGRADSTHFQFAPALVARVAAGGFGLDPARVRFPARLWFRPHPAIDAVQSALQNELLSGGPGGRLCAESLANVLVVHLIRHLAAGPAVRGLTGVLARPALQAVEEYVEDNLAADLALADLAAVAHLSEYHFARLFKRTTGLSPHQYVIARRIERAKELIREGRLTLTQVAAAVGFYDQSHLNRHFRRTVGVSPSQFR